jgi:hypothetical protein
MRPTDCNSWIRATYHPHDPPTSHQQWYEHSLHRAEAAPNRAHQIRRQRQRSKGFGRATPCRWAKKRCTSRYVSSSSNPVIPRDACLRIFALAMKHAQAAVSGPPAPGSQCGDTTGPNRRGGRADKSLEILPFSAASVGTGAGYSAQATDRSRSHVAVDGLFPKEERRKPIICGAKRSSKRGVVVDIWYRAFSPLQKNGSPRPSPIRKPTAPNIHVLHLRLVSARREERLRLVERGGEVLEVEHEDEGDEGQRERFPVLIGTRFFTASRIARFEPRRRGRDRDRLI